MYSLGIVTEAFLGIILTLDTWVYSLISSAYKIFMAIASARILQEDAYKAIAEKVYIIVGVGMLFVLAYAILKAIVDPDQTSKGDMAGGKIVKSIAIAVIGLIVTPMIFNLCYMAQGKILEDDILGKLFFRTEESVDTIKDTNQNDTGIEFNYDEALHNTGGAITATSVWQAFFYPAEGEDASEIIADPEIAKLEAAGWTAGCAALGVATVVSAFYSFGLTLVVGGAATLSCFTAHQKGEAADKIAEAAGDDGEVSLQEAYMLASAGHGFAIFQAFVEPIDEGQIKYTWFISTVCGVFVAYAFATYAIDMGLRAAKLAYYQVIAPIPLILQVLPKKGDIFSKYVKAVFTTFLEVFIRISVVYIVIYIIAHLNSMFSTDGALWDSQNLTKVESMIAMALLIIGLVLFAKQAPKLISETFGLQGGADLGLSMMDRLRKGEVFTAGRVIGSAGLAAAQGARANYAKTHTKDAMGREHKRTGVGRVVGAFGAGIAGAFGGATKSGVRRFQGGKDGYTKSFKDMKDQAIGDAEEINVKREARQQDYDQHSKNGIASYVTYKVGKAWEKLDDLTSPKVGEILEDKTIKAYGTTVDKNEGFRAKTGKNEQVRTVEEFYESYKADGKPQEYNMDAYKAFVAEVVKRIRREDYDSQEEWQEAVTRATRSIDMEQFRNPKYAAQLAEYQRTTNALNKGKEAMQDLGYLSLLAKGDQPTIAHFNETMRELVPQLREHADEIVGKNGETLAEVLQEQYGLNLDTGEYQMDKVLGKPMGYVIKTDKKDANGNEITIRYDAAYDPDTKNLVYTDAAGNRVELDQIMERTKQSDVVGVDSDSSISTVTDLLKKAKTKIQNDPVYRRRKNAQVEQKEKKNK